MKTRFTHLAAVTLFLGIALFARAQTEVPKPAPELKKLDYFAGTWTAEGEIKPGPMGPGGKFTGTNRVQWMNGAFFLVTHSEFNGAMGKGTETAYMGYDSNDKMYTYDSFNSMGEADHAKGNVDGDTWTWQSETRMGPQTIKGRLTIGVLSATAYNFKFEMSPEWRHLEHFTGRQRHEEIDRRRISGSAETQTCAMWRSLELRSPIPFVLSFQHATKQDQAPTLFHLSFLRAPHQNPGDKHQCSA